MERLAPNESELADQFVADVLLPFLFRCRPVKKPTSTEVAALVWGYESALAKPVSPFDVSRVLRRRIAEAEQRESRPSEIDDLIQALTLAAEAMPKVATNFWFEPGPQTS